MSRIKYYSSEDFSTGNSLVNCEEILKRIESANDRNNISLMTLYKISIILGVRIDKFFEE